MAGILLQIVSFVSILLSCKRLTCFFSWLVLIAFGPVVAAQDSALTRIHIEGKFLTDSFKVGMPLQFALTATYPAHWHLQFPDTGYKYTPFEYIDRKYTNTRTRNGISRDSVVYTLLTFETEPSLSYSLPVLWLNQNDTVAIPSTKSVIYFSPTITDDTLHEEVLPNLEYQEVAQAINYPFILLFIFGSLITVLLVNYLFGKPIQRYYNLFTLYRRHTTFVYNFDKTAQRIQQKPDPKLMEQLLNSWKKYIERLDKIPYSTYTTKEIGRAIDDTALLEALRAMDNWIYGGIKPEDINTGINKLKTVAEHIYNRKKTELKGNKHVEYRAQMV